MAKSMYEIIETGLIEVNHDGNDAEFEIPTWLKEASGKLESEEDLASWEDEIPALHALIQCGRLNLWRGCSPRGGVPLPLTIRPRRYGPAYR